MKTNGERLFLLSLLIAGLAIRIAYFAEYKTFLEFFHPTVDALYHHLTASAIASGALTSSEPFFRAPFYSYFLGFIYFLAGNSISAARFLQLLIGLSTPFLTYFIARKMIDRSSAILASLFVLFCGDLVYFEGELLLESLLTTLILLAWFCYLLFRDSHRRWWLLLSALATGFAVITRPNALVIVPVVLYLLWKEESAWTRTREEPISGVFSRMVSYVTVLAIPIGLVLAHNLTRAQPAFTIATQGGINFYIGNNRNADGVSAVMPGRLGYNWQYDDIKYEAEKTAARSLTASEVSGFYYKKAVKDIVSDPVRWLSLMVRKLYLVFSGADISNNRNLVAFRSQFVSLRLLPVGMSALAPLGLIGMLLAFRKSKALRAAAGVTLLYALSFILFFVNSRFRLPTLPFLAVFSAYTLLEVYRLLRQRSYKRTAAIALPVVILAFFLNSNAYRLDFDNRQQAFFSKGNLLLITGDDTGAIQEYHRSLALGTPLGQVNLNIGVAYLRKQQLDSARRYFELEDSLFSGSAEALNDLAYLSRQQKENAAAISFARQALSIKPYLEEARLNLWYALREGGFADSAYHEARLFRQSHELTTQEEFVFAILAADNRSYDQAVTSLKSTLDRIRKQIQPLYAEASGSPSLGADLNPHIRIGKVLYNLGYVYGASGQIDSAIVYLDAAIQADPSLTEAWINLGSAYFAKHDYPRAKDAFLWAARGNADNDVLLYNLALVSFAMGETEEATEYLDNCLRVNPDFSLAKVLRERIRESQKKTGG